MIKSSGTNWLKVLGLLGIGVVAVTKGPKLLRYVSRKAGFSETFNKAAERVDHAVGWDKLPVALGMLTLVGIRNTLRAENLYDTSSAPSVPMPDPIPEGQHHLTARTADGTFNDLSNPRMGAAGTRFGRNFPIEYSYPEPDPAILSPNPRTVSLELLTRHTFAPATTLNVLAASWLQFMIRDWFSHGKSPKENPWKLPLKEDDKWHENPMLVLRTRPDPTRPPVDDGEPPTYANTETHWWDGSQLYGSKKEVQNRVRAYEGGKLKVGPNGLIPLDPKALEEPGTWLGLALHFNLFTLEHNAICDRLHAEYPSLSDDQLFDKARLIISALLAKIHTVEWTPGILGHPTLQIAMRANWWGLAGEWAYRHFGRLSKNEVISGIVGGRTDHFGVPYSLTEEFVAVYRMHPLVPDDYVFRSTVNDAILQERGFKEISDKHIPELFEQIPMADLLYSFGVAHPGAIQLHNFPRALQNYERPDGFMMDLGATDILRSRELGVPRYNQFRQLLHKPPVRSFDEMTANREWAEEIKRVYDGDIDRVDTTVGLFAENPPKGFGFSDTAFRIFVLMASRRLNSDRFFTVDYTPEVYTQVGMEWLDNNTMKTVLLRHYPQLGPALAKVDNAFAPWARVGQAR
ncbi:MAG TPA: peroxidase family protein [Pyrinomonadaceae bacterium]|nr:peroxidase family protein [Pyrinomonadaceae bacterium]